MPESEIREHNRIVDVRALVTLHNLAESNGNFVLPSNRSGCSFVFPWNERKGRGVPMDATRRASRSRRES
jgi:hypothetical protein